MPRDINVIIEHRVGGLWKLVLPMLKNNFFNHKSPKENWLSGSMYIDEYYPELFYSEYSPEIWELLGVAGKYSKNTRPFPDDCCEEIKNFYKSFGSEAFDEHWLTCIDFLANVKKYRSTSKEACHLALRLKELGDPNKMRLILWFSQ